MNGRALASTLVPALVLAAPRSARADDTAPRITHFEPAAYPPDAVREGRDATVLLALTVDAAGHVTGSTVVESAGAAFDQAAIAASRRFVFDPALHDGTPVAARLRYRYRFTLQATRGDRNAPARVIAVLRGTVRDGTNHAVPAATVTVHTEGAAIRTATTDADGAFRFELDTVGEASVDVIAPGLAPYHALERLADHDDVRVVYRLRGALAAHARPANTVGEPDEPGVVVRGRGAAREVTRQTIEREELQRIPGTAGDALRAIQNLPGLARPPLFGGDLIVRGASPDDTAVFVDGTDLPLLYHFSGLTSTLPTDMLDRIDFYPGNFSARYGRAMGGVVDVGLRSPRTHGFHGVANLSAIDVNIFLEGPITPQLSFAIAARRSHVDLFLKAVFENLAGVGLVAAPVYYDYQAILEWRPNRWNRIRLAAFGDDDTVDFIFGKSQDSSPAIFSGHFNFQTRFHLAQLTWQHELGSDIRGRAMISAGWANTVFRGGGSDFRYDENNVPIDARYELSATLLPQVRLEAGFDVQIRNRNYAFSIVNTDPANPNADLSTAQPFAATIRGTSYLPAAYLEAIVTPLPGLKLVPGLRADYYGDIRQWTVSPRFSFRWDFASRWTIKGGVGLFTQPPGFLDSTTAPNTAITGQSIGNPNLLAQRAVHYAAGFEHRFSPWITLSVEGFYKTLDGLTLGTSLLTLASNPSAVPVTNGEIGRIYGAELMLRHRSSDRFFGWIAYTLMRSERRDPGDADWHVYGYDQTHILTVLGTYTIGRGWQVGARFRYVTGSPTTPVVGSYYNADAGQYVPISGAVNSARIGDFHQLDLRVDKTWRFGWGAIGLFGEVFNVYNHTNEEGRSYSYNYLQQAAFGGLPVFPNVGLRGEF